MAKFLSPQIIEAAVHRLIASRALSGFVDFLVLKRALARSGGDSVVLNELTLHLREP